MNYKNAFVYLLIALSIVFGSCIRDVVLSSDSAITSFYIPDQNGKSGYGTITFDIQHPMESGQFGLITNVDSFPFNTLRDSLIPIFTSSMNNQAIFQDTIIVSSRYTLIDFNNSPVFSIVAPDGISSSSYLINIKESKVNPTKMSWSKKTDSIPVKLFKNNQSFYFNDKIWMMTGELNQESKSVTSYLYSSEDGKNWNEHSISDSEFPMGIKHTICEYKNKLYSLGHLSLSEDGSYLGKNEIWESTDGIKWSKTGLIEGDGVIFREAIVLQARLVVFGGSKIDESYSFEEDSYIGSERSVHVFDGNMWSKRSDLPSNMPTRKGALGLYNNKLFYLGGESESGIASSIWMTGDGNYWVNLPDVLIQPTINASLIEYDDRLWMIGGEENDATIHTIQESRTEGLKWYSVESLEEEELAPFDGFMSPRAGQSAFLDNNNKLWIIGGYEVNFDGATPSKSYVFDVWSGKMNKFN